MLKTSCIEAQGSEWAGVHAKLLSVVAVSAPKYKLQSSGMKSCNNQKRCDTTRIFFTKCPVLATALASTTTICALTPSQHTPPLRSLPFASSNLPDLSTYHRAHCRHQHKTTDENPLFRLLHRLLYNLTPAWRLRFHNPLSSPNSLLTIKTLTTFQPQHRSYPKPPRSLPALFLTTQPA